MTTPHELVAATANRWDVTGLLAEQSLARLAWRLARAGKTCAGCVEAKPLSAFGRDSRARDGLARLCRGCIATRDALARDRTLAAVAA